MLFNSEGENFNVRLSRLRSPFALPRCLHTRSGRPIPRNSIAVRMGSSWNWPLHRPLCRRSCMVTILLIPLHLVHLSVEIYVLTRFLPYDQGYLHNRLLHHRWRRQSAPHPHQEPHLHHLLRSRCHLRRHHVDCFLLQTEPPSRRRPLHWLELLYRLRALLGRRHGRNVQSDMRRKCRHQRIQCRTGGCGGRLSICQGAGD
jgi:hypothetical protein